MLSHIFLFLTIFFVVYIFLNKNKNPEYLLFIPLIILSDFFGFTKHDPFNIKGFIDTGDIILALLFITFLWFTKKKKINPISKKLHNYNLIFLYFIIYLIIVLIFSLLMYGEIIGSIRTFRRYFQYSSYFLFLGCFVRLEKSQIKRLLDLIENITIILIFLYIINFGFSIPIFRVESYKSFFFAGAHIYRNFYSFPMFGFFILARILYRKYMSKIDFIKIILIMIAVVLSLTRNWIISAVFVAVIVLIFKSVKVSRLIKALKYFLIIIFLGLSIYFTIDKLLGPQLNYLTSRFGLIPNYSLTGIYEEANFRLRIDLILERVRYVNDYNPLMGLGFLEGPSTPKYFPTLSGRNFYERGHILIGDQSWGNIIANIGIVGTFMFLYLIVSPIKRSLFLEMKKKELQSDVLPLCLSLIIIAFIKGFFGTILIDYPFLVTFHISIIVALHNSTNLSYIILNKRLN